MRAQAARPDTRERRARALWGWVLVTLLSAAAPWLAHAQEQAQSEGEVLYRGICGACHSLELPESQRLDRGNWEWVLDDMMEKFGCPITDAQRALILEFLVEHRGLDDR